MHALSTGNLSGCDHMQRPRVSVVLLMVPLSHVQPPFPNNALLVCTFRAQDLLPKRKHLGKLLAADALLQTSSCVSTGSAS